MQFKVQTSLEACHVTDALINQQRVLAPAARHATAICLANDRSGATYLMMSHISSARRTLITKISSAYIFSLDSLKSVPKFKF